MLHRTCMVVSVMTLWVGTVGACQSDGDSEQSELQALLHDEPLQQVSLRAATSSPQPVNARAGAALADGSGPPVGRWNFDN